MPFYHVFHNWKKERFVVTRLLENLNSSRSALKKGQAGKRIHDVVAALLDMAK